MKRAADMDVPYTVDRAAWAKQSILEQMGSIYSEVGRSFSAKRAGRAEESDQAVVRALDLFDATAEPLAAQKSPRLREVLRAREQFLYAVSGQGDDDATVQSLDRYFMQFAVAARLHR